MEYKPQGPIHATPGGDTRPHLTMTYGIHNTWHVPYHGQTTLDMFVKPDFDPRRQWENIVTNQLGTLYEPGTTPYREPRISPPG